MSAYQPNTREMFTLLRHVLQGPQQLGQLSAYAEVDEIGRAHV